MALLKIAELNDESTGYEPFLSAEMWIKGDVYLFETTPAYIYENDSADIEHVEKFISKWQKVAENENFTFEVEKSVHEIIKELKEGFNESNS